MSPAGTPHEGHQPFFDTSFLPFPHIHRGTKVGAGIASRRLAHPLGCNSVLIMPAQDLGDMQFHMDMLLQQKYLVSCSICVIFSPQWNIIGLSLLSYPLGTPDYWMLSVIILTLRGKWFWYLKSLPKSTRLSRSVLYLDDIFPSLHYRAVIALSSSILPFKRFACIKLTNPCEAFNRLFLVFYAIGSALQVQAGTWPQLPLSSPELRNSSILQKTQRKSSLGPLHNPFPSAACTFWPLCS